MAMRALNDIFQVRRQRSRRSRVRSVRRRPAPHPARVERLEGRVMLATYAAGDVALLAINSANPDKFSFVNLKPMDAGDVVTFTDNGFTSGTAGRTGEGFLTFTVPAGGYAAGTVHTWTNGMTVTGTPWSSGAPTNFAINGSGDQLFVFTGSSTNWASQAGITLLYGLNFGAALGSLNSAATTAQPTALATSGFLNLGSSTFANAYYSGTGSATSSVTVSGDAAAVLADLTTAAKWVGTGSTAATFPAATVTIGAVVAPTVDTPTQSAVTAAGATLGGTVSNSGNGLITERGVVYSLTSVNAAPEIGGTGVVKVAVAGTTGAFSTAVTGLVASSGYTYRAYATNSAGTSYSDTDAFTTLGAATVPGVTGAAATVTGTTSATLAATVSSDGGDVVTERGFVYALVGDNADPAIGGTGVTRVTVSGTTGAFSTGLTGLALNTGYAFKAYATNAQGTTYTSVATFTTDPLPTSLAAGDLAVIGYNTNGAPDSFTILVLRTLTAGTTFFVNDNAVAADGASFASLGEAEAAFTVTAGHSIAAGSVITLPWGASASDPRFTWSMASGGLGSNNEELNFYTAAAITDLVPSTFLYGVRIGTTSTSVRPGSLAAGSTFITPDGAALRYKTSGAVYTSDAAGLLASIGDVANNWEAVAPVSPTDWTFTVGVSAPIVGAPTSASIASTAATLGGDVLAAGGDAVTERGVVYAVTGVDATPTVAEADGVNVIKVVVAGTTGGFTVPVSGLMPGTSYSYRAYATNGQGTTHSAVGTFTTLTAPTVGSPTATLVTSAGATLGGDVTSDGGSPVTERGIVYALTSDAANPEIGGTNVTKVTVGGTTGVFSTVVTGLTMGSGYSYRAYATNAYGTTYSTPATFTTEIGAVTPTVVNPSSSIILDTSATLGGEITTDGGDAVTERGIVFSVTTENGDPLIGGTGVTKVVADGTATGAFTAPVTGLNPATGYSFKAYATNGTGTSYTSVAAFTTLAAFSTPTVGATTTSVVTAGSARLAAEVTSDGGNGITERGFVYAATSTNAAPQLGGSGVTKVAIAGTSGAVAATLTGLSSTTGYTVRAFATNAKGTTYGDAATFTTAAVGAGPGLLVSEILANPAGSDLAQEYVEFVATRTIDFAITPYSVVFTNNGTATANGWVQGGGITYGFAIASGSVVAGDVVYVGGSGMAPTGAKLRVIDVTTTAGDRFGSSSATGGVLGNGGGAADGVALFDMAIASLTSASVPVDAVFFGTGLGTAVVSAGTAGYELPVNDAYAAGKLQTTSSFQADPASGSVLIATGIFNASAGVYSAPRAWTVTGIPTDGVTDISVQAGVQTPVIVSPTQASVTSSSATLGGTVTSSGSAAITERGIVYAAANLNADPSIGGADVTVVPVGGAFGTFTTMVSGLGNGAIYAYKAYATNADGQTSYTAVDTFMTLAVAALPSVAPPAITALGGTSAALLASVTGDGGAMVTERGIVYALASVNADPTLGGTGATSVTSGTGTGDFTAALAGLTAGGAYVFKAYATNSSGTAYSTALALSTPQPFTPGNLVVLRAGDGTKLLDGSTADNDAASLALLEITTAGVVVQTIPLPSVGANRVVLRGNSTSEGTLALAGDGQSVTFGAYRADVANANPTTDAAVPRVIGRIAIDGSVDTSQALLTSDGYQSDSFRGVVTNDGTAFWLSGAGSATSGGVRYVASTTATTSTSLNPSSMAGNHNTRQIAIAGGNLFVASGSALPGRTVWQVGTGLPTTADQPLTSTFAAAATAQYQSFYLADLDATADWNGTGMDTLYASDTNGGTLEKFAFVAGTWTSLGTVFHAGIANLTGVTDGATVTLYVAQSTAEFGTVSAFVDAAGYNAAPTAMFAELAAPVVAGTNYAFRGISLVPQTAPQPGATQLVVTTQPSGHTYGETFGLVVEARDASNVLDTSYTGNVTIAIASGSGSLAGSTTVAAVGGVATFSGLSLSAVGAFTFDVAAAGLSAATTSAATVGQKALAITGMSAIGRQYDGTRAAALSGTAALVGVVGGDDVSLTGTGTGTFDSKDVNTATAVSVSGFALLGAQAGNYTLTQPTLAAGITAKALTVVADGKTRVVNTANPALSATIAGFVNGETAETVLTGAAGLSTTAVTGSAAGAYPIAVTQGTLAANGGNYSFGSFTSGVLQVNATPVKVKGVYFKGSGWVNGYVANATLNGVGGPFGTVGGTALGFRAVDGSGQMSASSWLSWTNVNTISVQFDQAISQPAATALQLARGSGSGNVATTFTSAPVLAAGGTVAQWTLPSGSLANGKYVLSLPSTGIVDASGTTYLDGEWTTGTSTFSVGSGNGAAGGMFVFTFNVLQGNVAEGDNLGRVNTADVSAVKTSLNAAGTTVASFRRNVDGSSRIDSTDYNAVKTRLNGTIATAVAPTTPSEPAAAPLVGSATALDVTAIAALLGGQVVSDGGDTITERGVVYAVKSTNANPVENGTGVTKVTTTGTTGTFTVPVTGLASATTYVFKVYARNARGTTYSLAIEFTTLGGPA